LFLLLVVGVVVGKCDIDVGVFWGNVSMLSVVVRFLEIGVDSGF